MTLEPRTIAKRLVLPGLLALVLCAFFQRTFFGERFYAVDFFQTFVPLRTLLADAWSQGVPLWTGRLGNGSPVLANPGYAALYFPNLLYLGSDHAWSMTVLTVAHFVGGALGAWLLARRWGMSRAASWSAAIGFSLSGPAVSSISFPNLCWPLAWLPWAIVAHEEATGGRAWRGIVGLAFVWFSMVSMGDPVVLAAALAGCALLVLRDVARARRARPLVLPAVAGVLALILASPLLVALARYFPSSVRSAGFKAEGIVQWSLHPALLAGAILPNPYGDPSLVGPAGFWATALAADRGRPLLAGLYVGGLIVALAILGVLRRSPHRWMLAAWLGVLVLFALGKYGPIYPLAGEMNGFDALRYPAKWIVPAMLPLALLAASGLDSLDARASDAPGTRRGVLVLLGVLAFIALVCVGLMAGLDRALASLANAPSLRIGGVPLEMFVRGTWLSAAARSAVPVALGLLTLILVRRARSAASLLPVLAALATLDVALANQHLVLTVPADFYDVPRAAAAILDDPAGHGRVFVDAVADESGERRYVSQPRSVLHVASLQRDCLAAYVGASAGLSLAFNSDTEAFSPFDYARAGVLVRGAPLREKLMLLGAAGATHVVTFQPPGGALGQPIASIAGAFNVPLLVYRNPFAVPRARIVPRLTAHDADAGFIRAVQSAPDDLFRRTALVEQQDLDSAGPLPEVAASEGGSAEVVAEHGRSLVLRTQGAGGFLVVSDALVPGWTALVDGKPAPLLKVDLAFRAVPVPAGAHVVEMRYNPWWASTSVHGGRRWP